MVKRNIWLQCSLILTLAACGSGKDTTTDQNNNSNPSFSNFQLKADVHGLNGKIILTNQRQHEVTIEKNGITTFPSTWVQNSQYEIKVMDEPCAQRCTIDEARGQISTTGSKTLSITCSPKTWDYPIASTDAVSFPNTSAESPYVVMNKYGDMVLTWYQNDYYNWQLFKKNYENGKWTSPSSITDHFTFAASDAVYQSVDLNDRGEASILWSQDDGSKNAYVGDYDQSSWSFPTQSNTFNVGGGSLSDYPMVVKSNNLGEKIAVWGQTAGSNVRLYKAEYRNGNWGFPTNIVENINPDGYDVAWFDAAIDDLGNIVIVWQQSNGVYEQIFKSEYRNGIWSHPVDLQDRVSYSGSDAYEPHVAMNNLGDSYVVWHQFDTATTNKLQVFVSEYHQGVWTGPTSRADNISPNGKNSKYPKVVTNDVGQVKIVSMYQSDSSQNLYQIAVQEKSTTGWDSPMILSSSNAVNDPSRPMIDMDIRGNTLVAWSLQNTNDVFKAEYRNGNWLLASMSSPVNFMPSSYDSPSVAVNNCRAAITWQQKNAAGVEQVYIAQYH